MISKAHLPQIGITELIVNECSIILAHVETNQCMCCNVYHVPFAMLAHILWLPKKGVADLCL